MQKTLESKGFSAIFLIVVVLVAIALGFGGWLVWGKSHKEPINSPKKAIQTEKQTVKDDNTIGWPTVTSQGGILSFKVPDGWSVTRYPGEYIGSIKAVYTAGSKATIEAADNPYMGHLLQFRASIGALDDAGLGPQWSSPQPGLTETTQDVHIASLNGKRFKGVFTPDIGQPGIDQTVYEYVFALDGNKKLDIVYVVDHTSDQKDEITIVEKVVNSIQLK